MNNESVILKIHNKRTELYKTIKNICSNSEIDDLIELLLLCDAEIAEPAYFDHLTGLRNRAAFDLQLSNEIERAKRYDRIFTLVLFDLDYFKNINDSYGHLTGDKVLKETASILVSSLRRSDGIFRFGGDEFAAICPETSDSDAQTIIKRFEGGVTTSTDQMNITLGISWGASSYPNDSNDYDSLLDIADKRLYECKQRHHK